MNILQKLTVKNLVKNKRRSIVTIIGVVLSSALILAVAGMATSFQKMMINYAILENGDYHDMFEEVPVENLELIENHSHVKNFYYSRLVTAADLDEDEYASYQEYPHQSYSAEDYQRLDSLPDDATGNYNIYVRYDNPKNYEEDRASIQAVLESATGEQFNYRTNSELLRYEAFAMSDSSLVTLYSMAAIVISIIIVTSIFVIRNSFSISATERSRQFGMLASIGATPRQIRHSVYFEGLAIGLIGVPLGILLGVIAVAILVLVVNALMSGIMHASVEFYVPLWIFAVVILLSAITIFFSSLMPAIRAARLSPVEAIRSNQDIKIKQRKLHTPRWIKKCFGVGGVIAHKNLKRSRKKYRTTVISIVLSVATFIGLYSFLSYGQDLTGTMYSDSKVDYVISGTTPEVYRKVQEKFHLDNSAYYLETLSDVQVMQQSQFEAFAKQLGINQTDYSHVAIMNPNYMSGDENGQSSKFVLKSENVKSGDKYTVTRQPAGKVPASCRNQSQDNENDSLYDSVDWDCYHQAVGYPEDIEITITKTTDQYPVGLDANKYWVYIIVPENYYLRNKLGVVLDLKDNSSIGNGSYLESNFYAENVENGSEISTYLGELSAAKEIKTRSYFHYVDLRERSSEMRRMYLLISIFLYGFIIVVALIGVTNIFNTITTNIALRAKEFAMLKSIGMTTREFNRMIRLESLMYVGKALLIGIPVGLGLSYAFYQSVANSVDFGWMIPWTAILISIFAVAILINFIMRYSIRQVEKQNIIETIRSENI